MANFKFIILLLVIFVVNTAYSQELMKVYRLNNKGELVQMTPAKVAGMKQKKSALGVMAGGMLAKSSVVLKYEGSQSHITVHPDNALFYIYLPPNVDYKEISIGKLKRSKNERELTLIDGNGFSSKKKDFEDISLQKISSNIYALRIGKGYKNGEYAVCQVQGGFPQIAYDFNLSNSIQSVYIPIPNANEIIAKINNKPVNNNTFETQTNIAEKNVKLSDVDTNIPLGNTERPNTFALIIVNEEYPYAEPVPFASHDGEIILNYFHNTLGIPVDNILIGENVTLNEMRIGLKRLKDLDFAYDGEANFIIYYSGHGIPDESTNHCCLLPSDGIGSEISSALPLRDVFKDLSNMKSKSILFIIDSCFSGTSRNGDMLLSSRGIAIKPKKEEPMGSLIVLSACQGDETAFPYTEKSHGMLTYYFLKKLQESNGNVTLGELSDYVISQVKRSSIKENGKLQTPEISVSPELTQGWRNLILGD